MSPTYLPDVDLRLDGRQAVGPVTGDGQRRHHAGQDHLREEVVLLRQVPHVQRRRVLVRAEEVVVAHQVDAVGRDDQAAASAATAWCLVAGQHIAGGHVPHGDGEEVADEVGADAHLKEEGKKKCEVKLVKSFQLFLKFLLSKSFDLCLKNCLTSLTLT